MKWMKERDLLIAQTMAFVQSVTGKTPEAEKTVTAPVALLSVETSETTRAATVLPDIELLLASMSPAAEPSRAVSREVATEIPREISTPAPPARLDLREEFQAEIRARVASFRAHQERFTREREAYCSATMAKVHASIREGEQPARPGE
jgi:hypothetical protein